VCQPTTTPEARPLFAISEGAGFYFTNSLSCLASRRTRFERSSKPSQSRTACSARRFNSRKVVTGSFAIPFSK